MIQIHWLPASLSIPNRRQSKLGLRVASLCLNFSMGRCDWSVAKKTGSVCPYGRWSLWTLAMMLLAWHSDKLPHITTGFFQSNQHFEEIYTMRHNYRPRILLWYNFWMGRLKLMKFCRNMRKATLDKRLLKFFSIPFKWLATNHPNRRFTKNLTKETGDICCNEHQQ